MDKDQIVLALRKEEKKVAGSQAHVRYPPMIFEPRRYLDPWAQE
jgi:hypothetical protein